MCFVSSSSLCSKPNTVPQQWKWQLASARYARSGSSWPGQTLRGPSSLSLVWQTWVPLLVLPHIHTHILQSCKQDWEDTHAELIRDFTKKSQRRNLQLCYRNKTDLSLPQNFCSEAVCYSEMITRKIERNQLGRDHKSFTVQVTPVATQNWRRAHNDAKMSEKVLPWQHKWLGRNVCTQIQSSCLLRSSVIYTHSLHFSVALLLFLLFISSSTLCFSSFAPLASC